LISGSPPLSDAFGKRAGLTEHPHFSPLWGSVIRPFALMKCSIVTADIRARLLDCVGRAVREMPYGVVVDKYGATRNHETHYDETQHRNATTQRRNDATRCDETQYTMTKRNIATKRLALNETRNAIQRNHLNAIRNETQHATPQRNTRRNTQCLMKRNTKRNATQRTSNTQ